MSLYVALTFWLLVAIFAAGGVHSLWGRLVKPRIVNSLLLPGTLVAQLAHIAGLLITGNAVSNSTLMGDDKDGDPQSETPAEQKLPLVASILTGLFPPLACGACLYAAAHLWGAGVLARPSAGGSISVPAELPFTLAGMWGLLHAGLTLMQNILDAVLHSDLPEWKTVLFLYLAICLTVRMAPFEGNRRGALAAIVLSGLLIAVAGSLTGRVQDFVTLSWPVLSFAVGTLLFLLFVTLIAHGLVGLIQILAKNK